MGAHCGKHASSQQHRQHQDNVQQLSNTMLTMQMAHLGDEPRAALDLRWLLEAHVSLQHEYLRRLETCGASIQHLLVNGIIGGAATPLKARDRLVIYRLGRVMATSLVNLETLEFWHVCQSNMRVLGGLLTQATQIKTLKLEYGINHSGVDDLQFVKLDLTNTHVRLERLEVMGFTNAHVLQLFQATRLPTCVSTLVLSCDMYLDEFDPEHSDRTKLSVATLEQVFQMPTLAHLVLNGVSLHDEASAQAFCQWLRQASLLQSLSLTSCLLPPSMARTLVDSMARAPVLTKIHLTLDFSDFHLAMYLRELARHLPHMTRIRELYVATYYDGMEEEYSHEDLILFLHGAAQSQFLTTLSLPWVNGWTRLLTEAVARVIWQCLALRKLYISVYGDNDDPQALAMVHATRTSSSLECVDLCPLYPWSIEARDALERSCRRNKDCRVNGDRIRSLLQEPNERTRSAYVGAALAQSGGKQHHVVYQSLVMAVNLFADGLGGAPESRT